MAGVKYAAALALLWSIAGSAAAQDVPTGYLVQGLGFDPAGLSPLQQELEALGSLPRWTSADQRLQVWDVPPSAQFDFLTALQGEGLNGIELGGEYTTILTPAAAEPPLDTQQGDILAAIRESTGPATLGVYQLAPAALTGEAMSTGFGTRDGLPEDNAFQLQLPGGETVTAVARYTQFTPAGLVWQGSVSGKAISDVMLILNDGEVRGSILADGKSYSVRPLGGGSHVIVEDSFPPDHPPGYEPQTGSGPKAAIAGRDVEPVPIADTVLDVVVAYTPKVARQYKDVALDLVNPAVTDANSAFLNSQIGYIQVRVLRTYATDYAESTRWEDHISLFAGQGDGAMDEIHAALEETGADIAVLLLDANGACGEAREVYATPPTAFIVVKSSCAVGNHSFAHELGHLVGGRHDDDAEVLPYEFGHGFIAPSRRWRTIMAYPNNCGACPRRPYWSREGLLLDNENAWSDQSQEARVWELEAGNISRFRSPSP